MPQHFRCQSTLLRPASQGGEPHALASGRVCPSVDLFNHVTGNDRISSHLGRASVDGYYIRMLHFLSLLLLLLFVVPALANTEKVVFVAPEDITLPNSQHALDSLLLHTLSPAHPTVRSRIPVVFADDKHPRGNSSWYLLEDLVQGRRYELRICWAATVSSRFLQLLNPCS